MYVQIKKFYNDESGSDSDHFLDGPYDHDTSKNANNLGDGSF